MPALSLIFNPLTQIWPGTENSVACVPDVAGVAVAPGALVAAGFVAVGFGVDVGFAVSSTETYLPLTYPVTFFPEKVADQAV